MFQTPQFDHKDSIGREANVVQYEVKAVQKVGVKNSAEELSKTVKMMSADGWTVQQILGSPDMGFVVLFAKESNN